MDKIMNNIFEYYRDWLYAFYQENPVTRPEDDIDEMDEAHKELEGDIIDPKENGIEIEE